MTNYCIFDFLIPLNGWIDSSTNQLIKFIGHPSHYISDSEQLQIKRRISTSPEHDLTVTGGTKIASPIISHCQGTIPVLTTVSSRTMNDLQ